MKSSGVQAPAFHMTSDRLAELTILSSDVLLLHTRLLKYGSTLLCKVNVVSLAGAGICVAQAELSCQMQRLHPRLTLETGSCCCTTRTQELEAVSNDKSYNFLQNVWGGAALNWDVGGCSIRRIGYSTRWHYYHGDKQTLVHCQEAATDATSQPILPAHRLLQPAACTPLSLRAGQLPLLQVP